MAGSAPALRWLPLRALALWLSVCLASSQEEVCHPHATSTCLADDAHEQASKGAYFWNQQKGGPGRSGFSPFKVPTDISKAATWNWSDPHNDVNRATPLIDDKKNIYLSTIAGRIYKWSEHGELLWSYNANQSLPIVAALYEGVMYTMAGGDLLALDMETGRERWTKKIADHFTSDTASMFVFNGTLVFAVLQPWPLSDPLRDGGNTAVLGASAKDGTILWRFFPNTNVYNFQASSPGDGTVVFQDRSGGVYRLSLADGRKIWWAGVHDRTTFTTAAAVTDNGKVFAVSNLRGSSGYLHVYRLSDGKLEWHQYLPHEAMQAVAVGRTEKGRPFVVIGIGPNPSFELGAWYARYGVAIGYAAHQLSLRYPKLFSSPQPAAVAAFDAETGEPMWYHNLEPHHHPSTLGDNERSIERYQDIASGKNPHNSFMCLPDACSQPVIAGDGTAYFGFEHGKIFAIKDKNEDGMIGEGEVSEAVLSDGFQGSMGLAPGMLVAAPCGGGLYVWKE